MKKFLFLTAVLIFSNGVAQGGSSSTYTDLYSDVCYANNMENATYSNVELTLNMPSMIASGGTITIGGLASNADVDGVTPYYINYTATVYELYLIDSGTLGEFTFSSATYQEATTCSSETGTDTGTGALADFGLIQPRTSTSRPSSFSND